MVTTTAAAAPSANMNKSGGVQTMAGKNNWLWIWMRVGGCSNYNSSSSSICEHKQEQEGANDGGEHKQWWASDGEGLQTKAGRRDNGRWLVGRWKASKQQQQQQQY
jgi:hypothetical protein